MANQGIDRRTVLEMLGKAAAASQFPGFVRWAFGQEHQHAAHGTPPRPSRYQPTYFSESEYHTIEILTGLIIPAGESPGAREAGVSEFIDFLAAHGEEQIQQPMRDGLAWLAATAQKDYRASFAALTAAQQTAILEHVAYHRDGAPADPAGRAFFNLIRRYTVMGYYTSRVGLEELNYPGLQFYTESPACPHTNDPEHRHLPPPRV